MGLYHNSYDGGSRDCSGSYNQSPFDGITSGEFGSGLP